MAESTIKIQLEHNLKELTGALGQVKTDKFQQERIAKHTKGAELSLQAGDLQTFRKNFNQLMGIFKDAAAVTGNLSQRVTELTKRQTELSKKIDETQGKLSAEKAKIGVSKKGEKGLTKDYANTFLKNQEASKKILDINDTLIDDYGNLASKMKELNKEFPDIRKVTNEGAQRFGFKNIASVRAANQVVKAAPKEISGIEKNITDYEQEISQSQEEYKAVSTELEKVNNASQEAAGSLNKLYASINKLGNETNSSIAQELHKDTDDSEVITSQAIPEISTDRGSSNGIGRVVKQFTLYHLALRSIKQAAREAVQTVKELDKSLTEQAMVTGKTREQTYQLLKGYQELAGQLGATTKDVAAVATEYMKQGKTTKEAMVLTEAAISAAKVAGISAADSVNYLTTALNGFRLEAEQAMNVSDKFAAIAAASATDYNELAVALSKVASQANLAGMSIDYTTALLAKGLETTREAPETMGTALKTIIARMRELGDYGETLEGDMDLNNVESQLAYVGIALRDQQGDLRSTEGVLDELGRKWETLSTNQQAAIAKALAGTRQQSRLIAMMEDYDRVIELQDISARSAGATAAQAAVYLEGMEGALNKINVAWEKIVTAGTDSEMIIQLMEYVSDGFTVIGEFLETTEGQIVLFGSIASIAAGILTTKIAENELEKTKNRLMLENVKHAQKEVVADKQKIKIDKQGTLEEKKQELSKLKQLKTTQQETLTQLKANNENGKNTAKIAALETELAQTEKSIAVAKEEVKTAQIEYNSAQKDFIEAKTEEMNISNQLLQNQAGLTGQIYQMISPILTVISLFKLISGLIGTTNTALATSGAIIDANNAKTATGLAVKVKSAIAAIIGQIGVPGLVIGAALAAALGVGFAVHQYNKEKEYSGAEKTAERVEALAVEIYKLEQKSNAIRKVSSSFEDLDNNIIKTKEDIEEMNGLLDQAADSLDDDQKALYNGATSKIDKIALLEKFQQQADDEIRAKQREALQEVTSSRERSKLLNSDATDTKTLTTQTLIKNINKTNLYEILDNSSIEAKKSVEEFASTILGAISPTEAYNLAMGQAGYTVEELALALSNLSMSAKGTDGVLEDTNITEILNSADYSLEDRIKAYEVAFKELQSIDGDIANAFVKTYKDLETIKNNLYNNIKFIDSQKMSYDAINDISDAIIDLGNDTETAYSKLSKLLTALENDFDVESAIVNTLGINKNSDDYKKILSNLESAFGIGLLNIGQQADKLKNQVNSVYETVSKWDKLTESEKTTFLLDNQSLFEGVEDQEKLYKAIENQDYDFIASVLKNSKTLKENIQENIQKLEQQLAIEEARGAEASQSTIQYIKEQIVALKDADKFYLASLDLRLEAEQEQLNEYKTLLEQQNDALVKSLEKRKSAYEDYFSKINEAEESMDYIEQAELLERNLSRIAADSTGAAGQQRAELEKQLEDLAKERAQELRQQAQEQIIENIDDQIEQANKTLENILSSQQALLTAFTSDINSDGWGSMVASMIASKNATEGFTELSAEKYIQDLQGTFGAKADVDWDAIDFTKRDGDIYLTVNGQEVVNLSAEDERTVYNAITTALAQVGYK